MNYNSKEFYINMKEKDIPKWDPLYTYDEQDDDVKQFWDNEALKLTEGVTINGVYIHPWLYWHLNFWHMMLDKGMDRVPGLSSLRDNEWFFAEMLQKAEEQNKAIFMFGTRRFGKALLNSEILYMEQGEKTIGEALVGDKIYDDAGNLTEITGVYPQGRVMTYKVTFEDGRNCICCGDHLWRVKRLGSWKVLSLKSLIASNYKECSIQLCEAIDYPDAKLPIAPNAYGAMMAAYLSGDSNDIVLNKSMNRLYIRSSRRQKKIFIESFIKYMGSIVTSNEKFYIKNIDYTILHFVKQMFWSCGWYASFDDGFLTLSSTKKEIAITSIEIYGNHEATCITVSNQSRLFLTTNYIVTHNSAIMSSFLARNATMTYNLTHNVICASADDLLTLTEYLEFGLDNMHPFLKINRTGNNWDKEVVLGTRNIRNERDVHARIRITNIDQGKTAASLKTAGGTPFTSIYDEVGKFPFLNAYLAGKPAHMANGRMRGMILAAGCCCAGTVVYKANGEPCLIENLKQEDGIIGFDVNNSVVSKEHITWMKPPSYKDCYRITTNRGRILECSGDHPILTVISKRRGEFRYYGADFRRMDSLRVGRKICISDSVDIWGEDSMDDPYFIGMLIGNGTYGFDKTPVLATSDDEVYDYVNSRYDCVIEREYKTKKGKNYKEIRIKGICKMLRNLGIYGQTGKNKTLPNNIHRYKRSDIISFIMGYFDADSYFYEKKKKTNNNISIYSCNKTILEEVRVLLYKLGIISHICKEFSKHPSNRNVLLEGYKLVIRDKVSLLNYCNIIGSKIKYRLDVLNGIRKQVELFNTKGSIRTKYIDGVILEVVKKIEYIGSRQVYNLTASNTHTYLANGIITHNTGGNVEKSQDAQKVMNNPASYGFMVMDYDLLNKRCVTPTWRICKSGCFVPGQMSHAYPKDKTTLDKYLGKESSPMLKKIPISVTNYERSTAKIKEDLEGFSKSDKELFIQTKMAYPLTIDDCFLNAAVNRFPVEDATIHKNRLLEQGRPGQLVDVFQLEGKKMGWRPSDKMLAPFPFKGGNIDCPIVMYEEPPKDGGNLDDYIYVSSLDPYKQDKANTESLGAFYIFKRYVTINDPFAYKIVVSYVSRPPKSDDFCRNCEILIEGYGAKCLMENADRMFELYLARRNKEMLLLEDGEKVASKIIRPGARQNNRLGLSPTVPNQRMLYNAVLQYCWEEVVVGFDEDGNEIKQKGIYRIDDIELLEEMIAFGPGVNTDRIVAFGHALLLAKYYDDMNFMPKSTTEKMNQEKVAVRKLNQYKGFVLRRHNPFKLRR